MVEVGGPLAKVVRTVVEAMTALPDILAGLFIYTFLIIALGFQRSGFAAGMALSVMMLPIIARTADVAAASRAGRAARSQPRAGRDPVVRPCGVSSSRPRGPGLATAVILGMARAVGETAPVLITSGASTFSTSTRSTTR